MREGIKPERIELRHAPYKNCAFKIVHHPATFNLVKTHPGMESAWSHLQPSYKLLR